MLDGSAFDRPDVRRRVREAVEEASGRPVVLLDVDASPDERARKRLAARLMRADPSVASYDWRERRCRAAGPVLTALKQDVDGFYRVSLRYAERTRPATAEEIARRGRLGRLLHALRVRSADTVRDESAAGSVVMIGFSGTNRPVRVPIGQRATRVAPTVLTPRLDPAALAVEAIRTLPFLPRPRWDAVARQLTAAGCPFAAFTVCESRLEGTAVRRPLKAAALAAMRRKAELAAAPPVTPPPATDGQGAGDGDGRYSCSALCGIHMVEICNRDKALWNSHATKWHPMPCGARRQEFFLFDCYRRQWLTGAFHDACVVPCESTPEGRERLLGILQTAGCLHLRSS